MCSLYATVGITGTCQANQNSNGKRSYVWEWLPWWGNMYKKKVGPEMELCGTPQRRRIWRQQVTNNSRNAQSEKSDLNQLKLMPHFPTFSSRQDFLWHFGHFFFFLFFFSIYLFVFQESDWCRVCFKGWSSWTEKGIWKIPIIKTHGLCFW